MTEIQEPPPEIRRMCGLAFPYREHVVTALAQFEECLAITINVRREFRDPELGVPARRGGFGAAVVSMPIAAMHEQRPPASAVGQVRGPRKVSISRPVMQPK